MKARYSIVPKLLTPSVNPGGTVEVELFFSGVGNIEQNKLFISYPSVMISKQNAWQVISCIAVAKDPAGKITGPKSGDSVLETVECSEIGLYVVLNEGNFLPNPRLTVSPPGLPMIMSEQSWDNHAPMLLKLNSDEKAPSGDFDIRLVFTYSSNGDIGTSYEIVQVHITSWLDRHGKSATVVAIVVAVISSIITAVALIK
jgi:hypothetical protein